MTMKAKWFMSVALVPVIAAGCAPMTRQATEPEDAVVTADSRDEYLALASEYEQEANALGAKAERHRQRAELFNAQTAKDTFVFRGYKTTSSMGEHCEKLAASYRQAAEDSLKLGRLYRELADPARK